MDFFKKERKALAMKISIITVNFNDASGLAGTIRSVIDQKKADYEYIVIDGGSTDGSVEIINQYADKIDYWVSEKDRGIYHAMNKGVAQAHGDYCLFLNSGDCFYDNSVMSDISRLMDDYDIVVGKVMIGNSDNFISPPPNSGELTMYHLYSGAIPHQGSFIKTCLLREYPYDENLLITSDWKFFIQTLILDNCSVIFVDKIVARYDITGISSRRQDLMELEKRVILSEMFPSRILADYSKMKRSECLTLSLCQSLRVSYKIDFLLYNLGKFLLKILHKI